MTGLAGYLGVEVAALQEIIEAADAVPTVSVSVEEQHMPAAFVGGAVILGQQVDQELAGFAGKADGERDLARFLVKIMHEQHRIVAPVIADDENRRIARCDHLEVAPAHFGNFLAHPDDALGPIQHRVRIAPLLGRVDVFITVRPLVDHGRARLVALGESGMRLGRPLHRRARAIALGQAEIVTHRDLIAIADHGRSRQRTHQAIGKLDPPPVAAQHRRQPAANASIIKLHALLGAERLKHCVPLRLGQSTEIEFIVIAQEHAPLRRGRPRLGGVERLGKRPAIGRRQGVEQMLVDLEIEHHVHAVAVAAEIFHVGFGQYVGFGQDDGIALTPLQEFSERAQHVVLLDRLSDLCAFG